MTYTAEVEHMCPLAKGAYHGPAPIPEEGEWVKVKKIEDVSGFTHGIGWCAPQQGACKLSLNVKNGIIEEALVETIGCSGMTHSAAMASEILIGKTLLEALNTDLVCDAINTAMRELFMQIVYGRTQSAYSKDGLKVGASLEDLGKNLRSQVGTMFATRKTGPRYLEMTEGYVETCAVDKDGQIIGYNCINFGKLMDALKAGKPAQEAIEGGAKEIILSGVNIGDFGRSTGETFIDLLRALANLTPYTVHHTPIADYRIRISSCEPNLLSDEIIDFVANSRHFAPHFHIPLQSGSNTVLKIMGRRYTRELFAERVAHIKSVMPNAFIGVDCMVGVRGETAECWREYVDFIESLPVSQLHVFTYSERANTRMLEMDLEVVPQRERERRSKELHAISARKTEAFYAEHKGETATGYYVYGMPSDIKDYYEKVYRNTQGKAVWVHHILK